MLSKTDVMAREAVEIPLHGTCHGRRFARTRNGYMGIVPAATGLGDTVSVVACGAVPHVLRHIESDRYSLVGECYVHGIMDGEVVWEDTQWQSIVLV